jgi:hypothetical protein
VACAYPGYIPDLVLRQLPTGFHASQFVARLEGNKLVDLRTGPPQRVIQDYLNESQPAVLNPSLPGQSGPDTSPAVR